MIFRYAFFLIAFLHIAVLTARGQEAISNSLTARTVNASAALKPGALFRPKDKNKKRGSQ
jgi:hypothetical protein